MKQLVEFLNQFLLNPRAVVVVCLMFACAGVMIDGTLYRIWALNNEKKSLEVKIRDAHISIQKLQKQVRMAHDPKFIEREARDRFALVNKDDVVFVFAEE
jgi:cell division protein FtsB